MRNLTLTSDDVAAIEYELCEAGYKRTISEKCVRYFKCSGDSTYIYHSHQSIKASKNTLGQRIVAEKFGAPNGVATALKDKYYDTWFFNGYSGKDGTAIG